MRLTCNRQSLASAFGTVSGVVPSRTPKEILKNIKVQAQSGKVTLIGTDQEVGIRYDVPGVESATDGEILVPSARIKTILTEIGGETVEINVKGTTVHIESGFSHFQLSAIDPTEFPPVADFTADAFHVIQGLALRAAIRRTIFATDVESTRYALGGVLLELAADRIAFVATDSRRLALVEVLNQCRVEGKPNGNTTPVIPAKAMAIIERSIVDDEAEVHLSSHTNHVLVRSGNATIYSRLVEGRFPRYRDVVPKGEITVDLVVGPFHAAVRQALIVTDEESRGVDLTFRDGKLTFASEAADVGTSKIDMPISYDAEPITTTFDLRFIAEFLRVLEPEKSIRLHLIDGDRAAKFTTEDGYVYVIMPLSRTK
ncbi:MAG: DNA polymerase III subunit beta [Planctomycetaceae bacterium]|nr:DNA polymerase III subunit beta [Planctomycetaceae bacterium]